MTWRAIRAAGVCLTLVFWGGSGWAAEVMPPKPARYFNDYADAVPSDREAALNAQLEQFERETSNQLVVAVFPKMQSDSSLEDYTVRVFQSWGVGQRDKDNGAILFVFLNDRKMRIEVGYGLEPVLTDAECAAIIEGMKPAFRGGDFAGGLAFAVEAMMTATKGEYEGTGRTVFEGEDNTFSWGAFLATTMAVFFIFFITVVSRLRRGWVYDHNGRYMLPGEPRGWWMHSGGSGSSGSSGGGWSSGGGGGFSGGGGSSGGGGASGSW